MVITIEIDESKIEKSGSILLHDISCDVDKPKVSSISLPGFMYKDETYSPLIRLFNKEQVADLSRSYRRK